MTKCAFYASLFREMGYIGGERAAKPENACNGDKKRGARCAPLCCSVIGKSVLQGLENAA